MVIKSLSGGAVDETQQISDGRDYQILSSVDKGLEQNGNFVIGRYFFAVPNNIFKIQSITKRTSKTRESNVKKYLLNKQYNAENCRPVNIKIDNQDITDIDKISCEDETGNNIVFTYSYQTTEGNKKYLEIINDEENDSELQFKSIIEPIYVTDSPLSDYRDLIMNFESDNFYHRIISANHKSYEDEMITKIQKLSSILNDEKYKNNISNYIRNLCKPDLLSRNQIKNITDNIKNANEQAEIKIEEERKEIERKEKELKDKEKVRLELIKKKENEKIESERKKESQRRNKVEEIKGKYQKEIKNFFLTKTKIKLQEILDTSLQKILDTSLENTSPTKFENELNKFDTDFKKTLNSNHIMPWSKKGGRKTKRKRTTYPSSTRKYYPKKTRKYTYANRQKKPKLK